MKLFARDTRKCKNGLNLFFSGDRG